MDITGLLRNLGEVMNILLFYDALNKKSATLTGSVSRTHAATPSDGNGIEVRE